MRLICPNCDAQYEVPDDAIPAEGRDVQCSSCGHAWFQQAADTAEAEHAGPVPAHDAPEPDGEAAEPPMAAPPVTPPRRQMDESLLAVLREEAEREARARARAEPPVFETQGELGLESAPAPRPMARRVVPTPQPEPEPDSETLPRPTKGRDLLPDIEEINSTLRPVDRSDDPFEMEPEATGGNGNGFRSGFALTLLVAMALLALYVTAPQLAQKVPALADPLQSYVAGVDSLRLTVDVLVTRLLDRLQG